MKKSILTMLGAFTMLGAAVAFAGTTMTGWVTEAHCGAKGANAGHRECGLKCVKMGEKVAFYDDATKKVYNFDADCQKKMEGRMAEHVTLTGVTMKDDQVHAAGVEAAK